MRGPIGQLCSCPSAHYQRTSTFSARTICKSLLTMICMTSVGVFELPAAAAAPAAVPMLDILLTGSLALLRYPRTTDSMRPTLKDEHVLYYSPAAGKLDSLMHGQFVIDGEKVPPAPSNESRFLVDHQSTTKPLLSHLLLLLVLFHTVSTRWATHSSSITTTRSLGTFMRMWLYWVGIPW